MKLFSEQSSSFDGIVGNSAAIKNIFRLIEQVAKTSATVLLFGESGTGKELVAHSIWQRGNRNKKPFVDINMGAIAPELIISELFGHEKGAYTGAVDRKTGRFEQANGGTIFMDEISTMDYRTQIALLRVLETKTIHPIGARNSLTVNVRIIGATNRDLLELVSAGQFREDLYYRFNVFTIQLPPLRDRKDDIPLIANEYIRKFAKKYRKKIHPLSEDLIKALYRYRWPGNVRELKNVIHRAIVLCDNPELTYHHFPPRIISQDSADDSTLFTMKIGTTLREAEQEIIHRTLLFTNGNKQRTAKILGISRKALYNKIERFELMSV